MDAAASVRVAIATVAATAAAASAGRARAMWHVGAWRRRRVSGTLRGRLQLGGRARADTSAECGTSATPASHPSAALADVMRTKKNAVVPAEARTKSSLNMFVHQLECAMRA